MSPIDAKIRQSRLRWLGHVEKRAAEHMCQGIRSLKVDGKGKRGRPQKRWADCVKEDLKQMDLKIEDAQDRKKWKSAIHLADTI